MPELDTHSKILKQLEELSTVVLAEDPGEAGLRDINARLADVTNKTSKAGIISNRILVALSGKRIELEDLRSALDIKMQRLMSDNDYVTAGKSRQERESRASSKLTEDSEAINSLKRIVARLETLLICSENCLKTLKIAKECVSRQWSVISKQIELGELGHRKFQERK